MAATSDPDRKQQMRDLLNKATKAFLIYMDQCRQGLQTGQQRLEAVDKFHQTIMHAVQWDVQEAASWHALALHQDDDEAAMGSFCHALNVIQSARRKAPSDASNHSWATLHLEAECNYEFGLRLVRKPMPDAARKILEMALAQARQADALRGPEKVPHDPLAGKIAALLVQVTPDPNAKPMTRATILNAVRLRRRQLRKRTGTKTGSEGHLRRQLLQLKAFAEDPEADYFALWRQHDAEWDKYIDESWLVNARETARNIIRCADHARRHPGFFDSNPVTKETLRKWNEGELRELCLGLVPPAERLAFEQLEHELRDKPE
jgi:hypothetical protein